MRFSTAVEIAVLALAHVAACENSWSGSHAVRANAAMSGRRPIARRQIVFGNGTLTVGGITLGGNGNKAAAAAASNSTVNAEASAVSNSTANAEALTASNSTANAEASAAPVAEEPAEVAEEVSQGNVTKGEEAGAGAGAAEGAAEGEKAAAEGITAVNEAEQFSENIGIITDAKGNAVNLGGDLGITKGSDGSISVGGEAGINIAA
ncbi:hypothetical protein F4809DRAFT_295837 [Biscogniauxia mediterranea]|nr:hypothetical protein F4809DRAFT_295837 [Biscogniauxia mediterranea]